MGYLELWEFVLFALCSVAGIALPYFIIPEKIRRAARDEDRAVLPTLNAKLFAAFILLCGIGHVIMPFSMTLGMSWMQEGLGEFICGELRKERPFYISLSVYAMLIISILTSIVSWASALYLKVKI